MEGARATTLQRVLLRLGEGLLVGVGVAIVLGAFNAMSHATEELRRTRGLLEKQVEINQQLTDEMRSGEQMVSRTLSMIGQTEALLVGSMRDLATRLQAMEASLTSAGESHFEPGDFDWSRFEALPLAPLPPPESLEAHGTPQRDRLQDAIDAQRRLQ